jgi:hypothetical protein
MNNKYLDKVVGSLVRSTKIDYEKEIIYFDLIFSNFLLFDYFPSYSFPDFIYYCKNTFGLTEDEIEYVWKEYKKIILDKINNGK